MKTLVHLRSPDESGFRWHPYYAIFSLTASVVLAALVVILLVASAN